MAEKNIVENRPAEDIKERFSSNETVNTVMNGLGKVVMTSITRRQRIFLGLNPSASCWKR